MWPGVHVEEDLPERGRGVMTLQSFPKGTVICNYHGKKEVFTSKAMVEEHIKSPKTADYALTVCNSSHGY